MSPELMEVLRKKVLANPGGEGWQAMETVPLAERHPSMRDIPFRPAAK
jgi:hypothetical protein